MTTPRVGFTLPRDDAQFALERLRQLGPFRSLFERPVAALERALADASEPGMVHVELSLDDARRFLEWFDREVQQPEGDREALTVLEVKRVAGSAG